MKKKKLEFKKSVIVDLSKEELSQLKGGVKATDYIPQQTGKSMCQICQSVI